MGRNRSLPPNIEKWEAPAHERAWQGFWQQAIGDAEPATRGILGTKERQIPIQNQTAYVFRTTLPHETHLQVQRRFAKVVHPSSIGGSNHFDGLDLRYHPAPFRIEQARPAEKVMQLPRRSFSSPARPRSASRARADQDPASTRRSRPESARPFKRPAAVRRPDSALIGAGAVHAPLCPAAALSRHPSHASVPGVLVGSGLVSPVRGGALMYDEDAVPPQHRVHPTKPSRQKKRQ